ncbi:uncharacterized protein [Coffea arabica]|uniref:RNase H type-1 domain-containing protein n=1 Tax=Coffea arabica TaxID=13443 RepID=A0A6P6TH80_COFAR|nr:uncharacterized protein LOC113700724 [Coffea arabica]
MVFDSIWHPQIPLKISFFMLRLLLQRLPLPDRLRKLGLHLPSKCLCCDSASEESIEHLFSKGHIASTVWNYFGASCGLTFPGSSIRSCIVGWWLHSYDSEIQRLIGRILPTIVCWQIWKARNKALFEDVHMRSPAICLAISLEIQTIVEIHFKQVFKAHSFYHLYDWPYSSHTYVTYKLVRWEPKETGRFTLNTDGCSKGNPGLGGGGGVLRDSHGIPLIGFSAYLGETTCLSAEARALLIGIQTCIHRGFENLYIQSDSLVLIGILQKRIHCPWKIRREIRQIWQFVEDPDRFAHCYREANTVADALSNVGVSHPEHQLKLYDSFHLFPTMARGAIRLDRLGMPSIRKIKRMKG